MLGAAVHGAVHFPHHINAATLVSKGTRHDSTTVNDGKRQHDNPMMQTNARESPALCLTPTDHPRPCPALTLDERRGPATVRRGSESQDGMLSPDQQKTVHEWELKHGVVPLDEAHPHTAVEERLGGGPTEKRGPAAPRRGSMAENAPLSPTQVATMHEWELKHGIVMLQETRGAMEVD